MTVQRFDLGGFRSKPKRTSQGYLRLTGNLTRTGVLKYRTVDGKVIRELRHPEDVFAEDSLQSFLDADVTDLHPSAMVTSSSNKDVARGYVRDVAPQSKFITGQIVVKDAALIDLIESGKRRELSPGYTCTLEWGEGEYEGEKYDARQRNIVYNHLAFGPDGWGRSGPEVSVHMDSAATELGIYEEEEYMTKKKDSAQEPPRETSEDVTAEIPKEEIPEIGKPEAPTEEPKEEPKPEDGQGADPGDETPEQKTDDSLAKEIEVLKAQRDELQAKLDAANEMLKPEHLRSLVARRLSVETRVRKVLGAEAKFDSLSETELFVAALKAKNVNVEGKSADYIEARFDAMAETASNESIRTTRVDSAARQADADARQKFIDSQNAKK